ncbi:MAG TPA: adenylate/guanylate cyclase domain-containing protein [Candidatus Limnocylindrales bacterium]|nr:adenylate/guanylate cyclase domain-containing protein [Candidatus Limnocylindrales bacterium]
MPTPHPAPDDDAFWRDFLTRGYSAERRARGVLRLLPHGPRCKLCAAPFGGPASRLMRVIGKGAAAKNPAVCQACFTFMEQHHGGAEIEGSYLFADIRGSTALAETMPSTDFRRLIDRFYTVATKVVFDHGGGIDKFVGDEVVAFYFPLLSGPDHAAEAVATALGLLRATGHEDVAGPWVPLGVGVSTGVAWVGAVGDAQHTDLTALGDVVNVAARLGGAARAGEALVTTEAARAARLDPGLERRSLELKGKSGQTDVVRLVVAPPDRSSAVD